MTGPNLVGARLIPLPASVRWRVRPTFPFSLKSMCETPASHAGVCLGERLGVDLVGEAQPFTQGSGQVEQRGETSCLPTDYSSQHGELENS